VTSGVRLGTAAITTRGMGRPEMKAVAGHIDQALKHIGNEVMLRKVRDQVHELCAGFPIYGGPLG